MSSGSSRAPKKQEQEVTVDAVLLRLCEAASVSTLDALATYLGKDLTTVRVWKTRKKVPSEVLNDVSRRTGRSVAWLEGYPDAGSAGEGSANVTKALSLVTTAKQVNPKRGGDDFYFVPEVDVAASMGPGAEVDSEEIIGKFAFRRNWLRQKGLRPEMLAVVRASGDSMFPTVQDGDILLIDRAVDGFKSDGIYLIEQSNHLQCKRLQLRMGDGVIVKSDNPAYEAQTLSAKQAAGLRIAGRVVWVGGER